MFSSGYIEQNLATAPAKQYAATFLPLLLLAVIVVLLFGLKRTFAWLLVDVDDGSKGKPASGPVQNHDMALAVVGVYLVVSTLPAMLTLLLKLLFTGHMYSAPAWGESRLDLLGQVLTIG
ncbi:MAG: hypothetical protein ABIA59_07255 [Candidatus Latescibacterota bacterium]